MAGPAWDIGWVNDHIVSGHTHSLYIISYFAYADITFSTQLSRI